MGAQPSKRCKDGRNRLCKRAYTQTRAAAKEKKTKNVDKGTSYSPQLFKLGFFKKIGQKARWKGRAGAKGKSSSRSFVVIRPGVHPSVSRQDNDEHPSRPIFQYPAPSKRSRERDAIQGAVSIPRQRASPQHPPPGPLQVSHPSNPPLMTEHRGHLRTRPVVTELDQGPWSPKTIYPDLAQEEIERAEAIESTRLRGHSRHRKHRSRNTRRSEAPQDDPQYTSRNTSRPVEPSTNHPTVPATTSDSKPRGYHRHRHDRRDESQEKGHTPTQTSIPIAEVEPRITQYDNVPPENENAPSSSAVYISSKSHQPSLPVLPPRSSGSHRAPQEVAKSREIWQPPESQRPRRDEHHIDPRTRNTSQNRERRGSRADAPVAITLSIPPPTSQSRHRETRESRSKPVERNSRSYEHAADGDNRGRSYDRRLGEKAAEKRTPKPRRRSEATEPSAYPTTTSMKYYRPGDPDHPSSKPISSDFRRRHGHTLGGK